MEMSPQDKTQSVGTLSPVPKASTGQTLSFRKVAIRFVAVLISCMVGLVISEGLLRLFQPTDNRFYVWTPNYSATFTPSSEIMPGVGPLAQFQTNSQGIIGQDWSQNRNAEYRILTVGGSTTECLYLDKNKTWAALLQTNLNTTTDGKKVWVGNLGKAGFNTRDHLGLMQLAIDQYDIDALVLLVGGNDMVHRLMQGDTYDPYLTQDTTRYRNWLKPRFAIVPSTMDDAKKPFFKQTALWRLGQRLRAVVKPTKAPIEQDKTGEWLVRLRKNRSDANLVDELPSLESGLDEYERNITTIVQEARRRSIRVVLMTQPTIWKTTMPESERNLLWMGWQPGGSFYTTEALSRAMESYNRRLKDICGRSGMECVDLAALLPRSLEVFYDDMHFNEGGAQRVAAELAAHLKQRPPFATASVAHTAQD